MKIFALELSSGKGSVALIDGDEVIQQEEWIEDFRNREQLFNAIQTLALDWSTIDLFAVGRGPGTFSGMRISFSVMNALAAPEKKPVYALNSGAALAQQFGLDRLAVIGDARRDKVWVGVFEGVQLKTPFKLLLREELSDYLSPTIPVVSSDYERLTDPLFKTLHWAIKKNSFPEASALGKCVRDRLERGEKSEPFEPLYMHPPVFVKPRFS